MGILRASVYVHINWTRALSGSKFCGSLAIIGTHQIVLHRRQITLILIKISFIRLDHELQIGLMQAPNYFDGLSFSAVKLKSIVKYDILFKILGY